MPKQSFHMTWDTPHPKETFRSSQHAPFTWKERDRLSYKMTASQVLDTSEVREDHEVRRKRKWKEIRHFWKITSMPEYNKGNLENAFWSYGPRDITSIQFVMSVMDEFKFAPELQMEKHVKWLYWSLENGKEERGDWRELLAATKIITFFRLVKLNPVNLLLILFDIYALGGIRGSSSTVDEMYLENKGYLHHIFCYIAVTEMVTSAGAVFPPGKRIYRHHFRTLLNDHPNLVAAWANSAWDRLPSDLRLISLNEIENDLLEIHERKIFIHLQKKAIEHYCFTLYRYCWAVWKKKVYNSAKITRLRKIVYAKKRRRCFQFWHLFAAYKHQRRTRRLLAEVMFCYNVKARCFARIKLFIYTERNILISVGKELKKHKLANEGFAHMRRAYANHDMRRALIRWANAVAWIINEEVADCLYFRVSTEKCFLAWKKFTSDRIHRKRQEYIALENQNFLRDIMLEAEEAAVELTHMEAEREQRRIEAEKKAKEDEKRHKQAQHKKRMLAEKEAETRLLLNIQRDQRRHRIEKQMFLMRKHFQAEWKLREEEMIDRSIAAAEEYIVAKDSESDMKIRYEKLRKEFYAPPAPETMEKEKQMTSPQNIVFLFLEAKLIEQQMDLRQVIDTFDKDEKGYLSYDEFRECIGTLGAPLTNAQISQVIEGVDENKDNYIELSELRESIKGIDALGVKNSPWKYYVDPSRDILCYHNLVTGERVFEHQMTKPKLIEIVKANLIGDYITEAKRMAAIKKSADWQDRLRDVMARRIQNMAHLWFGRRARKKNEWRKEQIRLGERSALKQQVVSFLTKKFRAFKTSYKFKRELHCIYEKIWDVTHKRMFWYNHVLKTSTWDCPLLLERYGDVEAPYPWVPSQVDGSDSTHYWHVLAERDIGRKPDGFHICCLCNRNLALRRCLQCDVEYSYYCFGCHRNSHASPFGVLQTFKPNKIQREDDEFMNKLMCSSHSWKKAEPETCELCNSTQLNAAFHCYGCKKNLCRPCHRRTHSTGEFVNHEHYVI